MFGEPVTSVVAIGSKDFDIYRLQEAMEAKGWNLNTLQFPKGYVCQLSQRLFTISYDFLSHLKFSSVLVFLLHCFIIALTFHSIHLCVTHLHTQEGRADSFLRDVEEAVAEIKKNPQQDLDGKVSVG